MSTSLAPCPCGVVPEALRIVDSGQGGKWALVCGDCCNEWHIEFRTHYHPLDSGACYGEAVTAWNLAPRGVAV